MRRNILTIDIRKPVDIVFRFTLNPKNTPKWIPSILEERTSDRVVKVGTVYYQKVDDGTKIPKQAALVVTGFIENRRLDFHLVNGKYSCHYLYEAIPSGTRLTYSEENGVDGEIESPMTKEALLTLKRLLEEET
ncbi:hypothetical protein A3K63_04725 [Candidatus Micrarchaeota archaeon RBG_16_49_10]|nr:MAG: hypothetical protein A3K63_04725 [Candidatus Micrarchaeota archaeon RBG_16_49_10]